VPLNQVGVNHIEKKSVEARDAEVIADPERKREVNVAIAEADRSVAVEMIEMTGMTEVGIEVAKAGASDRNGVTIVRRADLPLGKPSSRKSRRP
jgi:hypothetical protein